MEIFLSSIETKYLEIDSLIDLDSIHETLKQFSSIKDLMMIFHSLKDLFKSFQNHINQTTGCILSKLHQKDHNYDTKSL